MDAITYFCLYLSSCCFVGCYLTGNDMHFDFANFLALVGCSGGAELLVSLTLHGSLTTDRILTTACRFWRWL